MRRRRLCALLGRKKRASELRYAGAELRDIVLAQVPCSCSYTPEYEEYLRLMATLNSTVKSAEESFALFVKYQFDGKQVERVCDVCRTVNQWDDLLETV